MASFKQKVLTVVGGISLGDVLTYKAVAKLAGNEKAARAVGAILRTNYDPEIPCHRVIKSNGTIGGYNRGVSEKRRRLRRENAVVRK